MLDDCIAGMASVNARSEVTGLFGYRVFILPDNIQKGGDNPFIYIRDVFLR